MNYDIINIVKLKTFLIKTIGKNLETDIKNMAAIETFKYEQIINKNDEIINLDNKEFYDKLDEDFKYSNITITRDIRNDITTNNEKYIPINHFEYSSQKLSNPHFQEIIARLGTYAQEIESFKSKVLHSVQKSRTYRDIENQIDALESLNRKGSETFFTKRSIVKPTHRANLSSVSNAGKSKQCSMVLNQKSKIMLGSTDEVRLNDPVLRKLFTLETVELYNENFKLNTKELLSSHSDLVIKIEPISNEEDFVKTIDGTNTINIYDKKNQKFTKRKIPLSRNPHGYSVFPTGCRSIMLGDKIYITGGRDEEKDYANVLVYDIKENKLKRIMDLNVQRSYHKIIYNDVFKTIMIFGGENEYTCEVFDPLCNRWLFIPPLNFPRANIYYHFDKPRGIIYALFGIEGKITNGRYSDVIEYLDLTDIKRGWMKLEYYNKSELKLTNFLNIIPLNNELLLGYGGGMLRNNKRLACAINLSKGEITKIGKELRNQLLIASKNDLKLNTIVSSLYLK